MKTKIKFLLWTIPYAECSGGTLVMYKLAEMLAKRGFETYTSSPPKVGSLVKYLGNYPKLKLEMESTMVIYPEIVVGNPFKAKYITRWILNTPGKIGGDGIFGENDLVYKYSDFFEVDKNTQVDGFLRCIETKKDFFNDLKLERQGSCYLVKKGKLENKKLIYHPEDSLNIDDYISDEYLLEVFNKKEFFFSYDTATYHYIQAALCGCIAVVIPDGTMSKEEWVNKHKTVKHGIAYGMDDLQWAKDTMKYLRSDLQKFEDECEISVDEYVKKCIQTLSPKSFNERLRRLIFKDYIAI